MRYPALGLSCSLFLLWGSAAAHEVRLKDGGKLRGITAGYDAYSFKVQTSYGYAGQDISNESETEIS
jgi:hypothetical protein